MLAFAWDADVFTATDAMVATGLTRSTAIAAIGELIELGLLRELPNARSTGHYEKGRPARRFELRENAAVLVGMDAGRSHVTAVVADLRGTPLARRVLEIDAAQDTHDGRRAAVLAVMDSSLESAGSARSSVLAVCVGVPAPVDAHGRSPLHPEGFWGRMNPELLSLMSAQVPLVSVENDASLAAVAENSVGMARGLSNFVVVLAGDRLGAGVVIDGHLLRGHHGGVGELRALDHVRAVGSADGLGLRLAEWAHEELAAGTVSPRLLAEVAEQPLTGRTVLRLASSGDAWAQRLVGRVGGVVARIVAVFSSIYDPERVVIAGAVADDLHEVLEAARAQMERDGWHPVPELVGSRLGADAVVTGAVAGARETALRKVLRLDPSTLQRLQSREARSSPST